MRGYNTYAVRNLNPIKWDALHTKYVNFRIAMAVLMTMPHSIYFIGFYSHFSFLKSKSMSLRSVISRIQEREKNMQRISVVNSALQMIVVRSFHLDS